MDDTVFAIEASGIHAAYGPVKVLRGVALTVRPGEVVALLGANGAGKTTLLEVLEGFRAPASGVIRILGCQPDPSSSQWQRKVGILFQSWRDHASWRVVELLRHIAAHYYAKADVAHVVERQLARVQLETHAKHTIGKLSGGQRRRLDFALATLGDPEVLFLDEPCTGLDPEARENVHQLIHELVDEQCAVLLTTHDMAEAERLADRVAILNNGVIQVDSPIPALRDEFSQTTEVRWVQNGVAHVHATQDAVEFVRELLTMHDDVTALEVQRPTLEDLYRTITAKEAS